MAPILKVLEFLRIIRVAAKRFPGRCSSLLAVLGKVLGALGHKLWRLWLGTFRRPKPADCPFRGTEASSRSASGGSAVVSEYVIAASYVPASASASASQSNLHDRTSERQPALDSHPPVPAILLSADPHDYPPDPVGGGGAPLANRSTEDLSTASTQSRASAERRSILTNSRESTRAPLEQPSRSRRGTHRQFGRGPPDLPESTERPPLTRLTTRPAPPPTIHPDPTLQIPTNLPSPTHDGDTRVSPAATSSRTHEPSSLPPMHENRRRETTIGLDVETPSTESLPQTADKQPAMGSSTEGLSTAVDVPDETVSSTSSNRSTLDYFIPDGRFVQLIHSEQIPRYWKAVTMQVGHIILSLHPYTSLQILRGESL